MAAISSQISIAHRDAHFLAVAKPVGIATTTPDGAPSLFAWVRDLDPAAPRLHPLSRLDTQVSGLVLFARTAQANQMALEARREGRFARRYLALAGAEPSPEEGGWSYAIGIDPRDPKHRRALDSGSPGPAGARAGQPLIGVKQARSRYRVRARAAPLVALDLWPLTGRTHQLRVHASAAGCPLAGDVAYGGAKRWVLPNGRVLGAGRVMLHCAAVRLIYDAHTSPLSLVWAPPEDMHKLWHNAGGAAGALTPEPEG